MANNHHEYEEVHPHDDDDAEDIELVGGSRNRQRRAPPPSYGGTSSSSTKWIVILFLIVLVGVYKLGMEEGKAEVKHETGLDIESKNYHSGAVHHESSNDNGDSAVAAQEQPINNDHAAETTTTTTTTTKPPKPAMKFTMDHLNSMRTECNNLIQLLDNYYFGKDKATAMLLHSYIEPWDFNEVELDHVESTDPSVVDSSPPRKLRAMKLVNTMVRALVSDEQRVFLMGGIGSSVMAGHDNW